MKAFRSVISYWASLAVVLVLMFTVCAPFLKMGVGSMVGVYTDMADAVVSGEGGEFSNSLLTKMDAGSQAVIGELGSWATSAIKQIGGSEFVEGVTGYVEGWFK